MKPRGGDGAVSRLPPRRRVLGAAALLALAAAAMNGVDRVSVAK